MKLFGSKAKKARKTLLSLAVSMYLFTFIGFTIKFTEVSGDAGSSHVSKRVFSKHCFISPLAPCKWLVGISYGR